MEILFAGSQFVSCPHSEVLAHLVVAAVFKTVVPCVNRTAGGFDSHALPLAFARYAAKVRDDAPKRPGSALGLRWCELSSSAACGWDFVAAASSAVLHCLQHGINFLSAQANGISMDTEAPQTLVNEQRAGPAYLSELLRQIARQSIAIAPVVFLGAILLGTPAAPRGAVVSGIVACSVASAAMLTMAFYTASLLLAVSMERNLNPEFRIPFGVGWFFYLGGLVTFLIALGLSPWLVLNPPAAMALSGFVAAVGLAMAFMLYQIGSRAEATESEQSHPSSSHSSELRDSRPK